MDASTSTGKQGFYEMQDFVKQLVLALPIDSNLHSRFGAMTFGTGRSCLTE